jgi:GT2 family glycosyltransferase
VQSAGQTSGGRTSPACPSVAVVMLHWGSEEVTKRGLQSLGRIAYPAASVILIDNTDTLPASVTGWAHPLSLDLVRPGRNLGFAEGCTVGMSMGVERGAEYVLLLNNDVVVDPLFLDRLVAAARACPEAGLFCPQIEFLEDRGRVWYGGGDFSLWRGIPRHTHWRTSATGDLSPRRSDFATGCAMLITARVIRTVGAFDARFFAYGEDLDLSLRARQARFEIMVDPSSVIWHAGVYDSQRAALRLYYSTRNLLEVMRKHARWIQWVSFVPNFMIFWVGYYAALATARRQPRLVGALVLGTMDFIRRRFGERRCGHGPGAR